MNKKGIKKEVKQSKKVVNKVEKKVEIEVTKEEKNINNIEEVVIEKVKKEEDVKTKTLIKVGTSVLLALVLYVLFMQISGIVEVFIVDTPFTAEAISFLLLGFLTIGILAIFKKINVLYNQRYSTKKTLKEGWLMLLLSLSILVLGIITGHKLELEVTGYYIPSMVIMYLCVGFCEEFLFRGVIQNIIVEKYGKDHKSVIYSIIVSSVLFGLVHAANAVFNQNILAVIIQVIGATAIGFYLGLIYHKTKNIWGVSLLHGIYDVCAVYVTLYLTNCATTAGTDYGFDSLLIAAILLIPALVFAMKGNLNSVLPKKEKLDKKYLEKYDTYATYGIVGGVVVLGLFIAFSFMQTLNYNKDIAINEYKCTFYNEGDLSNHSYEYQYFTDKDLTFVSDRNIELEDGFIYEKTQKKYNISIQYSEEEKKDVIRFTDEKGEIGEVVFDEEYISDFALFENDGNYTMMVSTYGLLNPSYTVYTSNYITNNTVFYKNFYQQVRESFIKSSINSPISTGYITMDNDDYKYPFIKDEFYNIYYKDKEGKLYKY